MKCTICGGASAQAFSHHVLGKYPCKYFYCEACGFLHAEEPHWLDEAYASAIAAADTGLLLRNLALSRQLPALLFFMFGRDGRYLDMAGGYGLLTRLMRDAGFDYYWADKYCENLLARGFEGMAGAEFDAVTAFEVLEHVPDPMAFVAEALTRTKSRTVIFSTELFSGAPPRPESWWYYAFGTGQHISFYQRRTLEWMAGRFGLRCYSRGSLHVFTERKMNALAVSSLAHPRIAAMLSRVVKAAMTSRTMSDHFRMLGGNQ